MCGTEIELVTGNTSTVTNLYFVHNIKFQLIFNLNGFLEICKYVSLNSIQFFPRWFGWLVVSRELDQNGQSDDSAPTPSLMRELMSSQNSILVHIFCHSALNQLQNCQHLPSIFFKLLELYIFVFL